MNPHAEISRRLIAELFMATGELVKTAEARDLDQTLREHGDHLLALMNVVPLLMRYPRNAQPLKTAPLGFAFHALRKGPVREAGDHIGGKSKTETHSEAVKTEVE